MSLKQLSLKNMQRFELDDKLGEFLGPVPSWIEKLKTEIGISGQYVEDVVHPLILPVGFSSIAKLLSKGIAPGVLPFTTPMARSKTLHVLHETPTGSQYRPYESIFDSAKYKEFDAYCMADLAPVESGRHYTYRKPYLNVGTIGHMDYGYFGNRSTLTPLTLTPLAHAITDISNGWSLTRPYSRYIDIIDKNAARNEINVEVRITCSGGNRDYFTNCVTAYYFKILAVDFTAPNIFEHKPKLSEIVYADSNKAAPTGPASRIQWQREDGKPL